MSRAITRYNICISTKKRVVRCQINTKKPLGASQCCFSSAPSQIWVLVIQIEEAQKLLQLSAVQMKCLLIDNLKSNTDLLRLQLERSRVARSLVSAGHLLYTSCSCTFCVSSCDMSGTNMVLLAGHVPIQKQWHSEGWAWTGECPTRPSLHYATA